MTREMDRRRETMIFVIAEVVLILVILASLLACQTKKEVSERIIVHDTLMVGHTDTLRITTHPARVDTIRESTTQYVTIRQDTGRTDSSAPKEGALYRSWASSYFGTGMKPKLNS